MAHGIFTVLVGFLLIVSAAAGAPLAAGPVQDRDGSCAGMFDAGAIAFVCSRAKMTPGFWVMSLKDLDRWFDAHFSNPLRDTWKSDLCTP